MYHIALLRYHFWDKLHTFNRANFNKSWEKVLTSRRKVRVSKT